MDNKQGKEKDAAAIELGRKGGQAAARNMSADERKARARNASLAKWAKHRAANKKAQI